MKQFIFLILFAIITSGTMAQIIVNMPGSDTSSKNNGQAAPARATIKPYNTVVNENYSSQKGLFTVHQFRDTLYFEIPDSLLQRDIEVINRLEKVPGGYGMYSGEALDEKTIRFELNSADSTIRIRYILVISSADPESDISKAVEKSNLNPVAISFPIKAYGRDHKSYVVDVSQYLKDKASFFNTMQTETKLVPNLNTGSLRDVRIEYVHAYPINVEISLSKNMDSRLRGNPIGTPATIVSHTSFIALPETPMQQRIFDERVGFFADREFHYNDQQQEVEDRKFILRWRLEPREEDMEKWKRGELVEPRKPIVIYIDPATPKQWRPYLIAGINDWQQAFEQAGFKKAIKGMEWPENDSSMHIDDASYSFLNYFPSEVSNAYGPQIHDPRSGEIIQTHIGWYHNVMKLLHDWYLIQAAAVDSNARHAKFDTELMGQLIRFVSSHEVGHTLGLRHNFGASSQTPVDSLRNKHYLERYGHTSSIMDYARFNYVAQPEDSIPAKYLFPRIGDYDRWAIEWGYKSSLAANTEDDNRIIRKWVEERAGNNPRLWFGDGESRTDDPRCQTEDLGDNAMKAGIYGIRNLQRILPNLPEWTYREDGIYENLAGVYKGLKDQYTRYILHVLKNIGGIWYTPQSEGRGGQVYRATPGKLQKEAISFFNTQLFTTPLWLLDKKVLLQVNTPVQPDFVEDIQVTILNTLLDMKKINLVLANTRQFGNDTYQLQDYIADIHKGIWKEMSAAHPKMDSYRRSLQKSYVGCLQNILLSNNPGDTETDAYSILRADMLRLHQEIKKAIPRVTDPLNRYHLEDLEVRVKKTIDANVTTQ